MAKLYKRYIVAALIFVMLFIGLASGRTQFASASASSFSDVLDDLNRDRNFNYEDFPPDTGDYSLQVKQIAESEQGELLIYVYQPACRKDLLASSINIARELDNSENLKFKNYSLDYLNSAGTLFKYRVMNFELLSDTVRYYNISTILRPYKTEVDGEPAEGQDISEVPNKVAQIWTVETVGDTVTYMQLTSEVIEITQKIVGYCAYDDGMQLDWGKMEGITKAYFVAFDTDRPIDKLISADLSFYATRIYCKVCANSNHSDHKLLYDFHDPEYIDFGTGVYNHTPLTITHKQKFSNQGGGNWRPANTYTWDRIRTTKSFISDSKNKGYQLLNGWEEELNETKWVLNFYEAQDKYKLNNVWWSFIPGISQIKGVSDGDCELNNVYDVQVLRLEFETDGKPYNLGVVDNKQSGNKEFNEPMPEESVNFFVYLWRCIVKLFKGTASTGEGIVAVVVLILGLGVLSLLVKILSHFIPVLRAGRSKK